MGVRVPSKSRKSETHPASRTFSRTSASAPGNKGRDISLCMGRELELQQRRNDLSRPPVDVILLHRGAHFLHALSALLFRHFKGLPDGFGGLTLIEGVNDDCIRKFAGSTGEFA